jgi:6-phosphogluconolactonase
MSERGDLQVCADSTDLARALASLIVTSAVTAVAERGAFNIALSGGTTPKAAYELLAGNVLRAAVSWEKVSVYFGDERCVPPDDERSNYRMASRAFLDAVPIPRGNIHRVRGEIDPGLAANEYASTLRANFGSTPQFDLVLLGLGEDGHTASLFPGSDPDLDDGALVRAVRYVARNDYAGRDQRCTARGLCGRGNGQSAGAGGRVRRAARSDHLPGADRRARFRRVNVAGRRGRREHASSLNRRREV